MCFLTGTVFAPALLCAQSVQARRALTDFPAGAGPLEIGRRVTERFLARPYFNYGKEGEPRLIFYPEACAWYGALLFAKAAKETRLTSALIARFEPLLGARDTLIPPADHVDHSVIGSVPLELFIQTKDTRYLRLGQAMADRQWEAPVGKKATPGMLRLYGSGYSSQTRMWIDDMFMINVLQAEAYRATGDSKYINRAAHQMVMYLDSLQQPNGLFYHADDVPFFWARGNGWMAAGMAILLRSLPQDNPDRPAVVKGYRKMMATLLQTQTPGGMWRQLVDDTTAWEESSGTAMFTYALISGVRKGWLDDHLYGEAARKGWIALVKHLDANADLEDVCEGTNKKNDRQYYLDRKKLTGDLHGQAPVLWCAAALLEQ